ncbi:MAG TPA: DUF416 family protein [Kofleriaceae bacterium]|nr:DUF416 family protein [Kofleriaceae bacterium]
MLHFDEAGLVDDLRRVSGNSRVAFAAACAQRLFPAYDKYCQRAGAGDQDELAQILERVWQHLIGAPMTGEQVRKDLARCMALVPGEDDAPWLDEQAHADDAASAIAYTLRALESGEPQEAAWAARRAYESADYHVVHRLGIEGESQILAHPDVQRELSRQRRDLADLVAAEQEAVALFVSLRDRARGEALAFYGSSA